jgi:hypothetical protein
LLAHWRFSLPQEPSKLKPNNYILYLNRRGKRWNKQHLNHIKSTFATKVWPFRHKRFAGSTGTTGRTGENSSETMSYFFGSGMLPKSKKRQTILTTYLYKAKQFTLNLRQRYGSMPAIVPDKAQKRVILE